MTKLWFVQTAIKHVMMHLITSNVLVNLIGGVIILEVKEKLVDVVRRQQITKASIRCGHGSTMHANATQTIERGASVAVRVNVDAEKSGLMGLSNARW